MGNAIKLPRRSFLHLAAGAAALPAMSRIARAQTYPTRPVRIIVGFPPGGTTGISARLIGQWLSQRLGQQFVVDNRPGAGGNVAFEMVARGTPDGYTLLVAGLPVATNAILYTNLNFNVIRDIAPVAGILRVPNVIMVNPRFRPDLPEFIAYARANPGMINMATAGIGSTLHIFGELFKMMVGVNLVTVHYHGGGPALTDLLGGRVHVIFDPLGEAMGYIRAGKLRALAVTSATRAAAVPHPNGGRIRTGLRGRRLGGMAAPKNTPVEIVDKLNQEINAGLADPKMKAQLADFGSTPLMGSPEDFGKLIADETEKWAKVIKFANIKAD